VGRMAMSRGGLLVHDREDWPCVVCQPEVAPEGAGFCLCIECAQSMLVAAATGAQPARALLGDLAEALALLEPSVHCPLQVVN
jgi:hypothetical protein